MKKLIRISILILMLLNAACSVIAVQKYEPYFKNTKQLNLLNEKFNNVEVTGATPATSQWMMNSKLSCRLMTFNLPVGKTVNNFVQEAMMDELDAAGKLGAGKKIIIEVKQFESDTSSLSVGYWTLDFAYKVGGQSFAVKTVTNYQSAFTGDVACRNTALSLSQALRDNFGQFFSKLVSH